MIRTEALSLMPVSHAHAETAMQEQECVRISSRLQPMYVFEQ